MPTREKFNLKRLYERARDLVALHKHERKERFLPYYYLLAKEMGEEVPEEDFRFALAVATYALENALWTEQDEELYEFLKYVVEKYGREDYWEYAEKSKLPLQDYLKANYDFR